MEDAADYLSNHPDTPEFRLAVELASLRSGLKVRVLPFPIPKEAFPEAPGYDPARFKGFCCLITDEEDDGTRDLSPFWDELDRILPEQARKAITKSTEPIASRS